MFDKLQKSAPMTVLALALPFTAAAKQGVTLDVFVYPGAPQKIVRNGQPGENFSISEFSDAGKKATQECLNGGAQAVTVSTPDLTR